MDRKIIAKWMPNGDVRFYVDNKKKSSASELMVNDPNNIAFTIICGNVNKVIVRYD